MRTRFEDLLELTELPWFDRLGDRLVLDPAVGPVVDVHTHLSLSFLLPAMVDQYRASAEVETYLPERGRALDLEIYGNRNLTEDDLRRMKRDLILGSFSRKGPRQTHTAANLLRRMADMRISHAVIHAIELPLISKNSEIYLAVSRELPRLIPFGSAHPRSPLAARRVRHLVRKGIKGLKVHPATQGFYPNDPGAMRLYAACRDLGLPVLWHCGPVGIELATSRAMSQVRYYEAPIAAFPEVTFFLGHSGALQYEEAIVLAQRYPNVIMDLSCQGLEGVRAILAGVDHDRIVFGSDWPFYHQGPALARVLIATEGDHDLRRRVLFENAARRLGISCSAPVRGVASPRHAAFTSASSSRTTSSASGGAPSRASRLATWS